MNTSRWIRPLITAGFLSTQVFAAEAPLPPTRPLDYGFAILPDGWRPEGKAHRSTTFAIQTGHWGFSLNLADLAKASLAPLPDAPRGYEAAVQSGVAFLKNLGAGELRMSLAVGGKNWRAVSCKAGTAPEGNRMVNARLWEAGRLVQHYDFVDLAWQDEQGNALPCDSTLDLVAWPESLTLSLNLSPEYRWQDGPGPGVRGAGIMAVENPLTLNLKDGGEGEAFTLEVWVFIPEKFAGTDVGWLLCKNKNEWDRGNFGFQFNAGSVTAVVNPTGGANRQHRIPMKRGLFVPNDWNHLALTFEGTKAVFYINGQIAGDKVTGEAFQSAPGPLQVGGRGDGGYRVRGAFDEIKVWKRALGESEVRERASRTERKNPAGETALDETFDKGAGSWTPPVWKDAVVRMDMKGQGISRKVEQAWPGEWKRGEFKGARLTLTTSPQPPAPVPFTLTANGDQKFPTAWDPSKACLVSRVTDLKRSFATGYAEVRDSDEILIEYEHRGKDPVYLPWLLDMRKVANITGLCPVLCDESGRPTGIPVQLSKNWHHASMGEYLMAYALLPSKPGLNRYRLRIHYGFYAGLPSASHAQLSLLGYGGNGRWDQLAIGCWGETQCFDMDMSLVPVAITDVRLLMVRSGENGKKWGWTGSAWGGDWLSLTRDAPGNPKAAFRDLRTAYVAHGPCFTEAVHSGAYGDDREVSFIARVRTVRTDDVARTFQKLTYRIHRDIPRDRIRFFRTGGGPGFKTPTVAWGNGKGLVAERKATVGPKVGDLFHGPETFDGPGPWWVAFPDLSRVQTGAEASGSRSVIVRDFRGTLAGGRILREPAFLLEVGKVHPSDIDVDLHLVPPPSVETLKAGDTFEMDVEWVTFPRTAADYYGPNEAFRRHLAEKPASWETTWREAGGNALKVATRGAKLLESYPVVVEAESRNLEIDIEGGVGHVPLRIEGIRNPAGFILSRVAGGTATPFLQGDKDTEGWQVDLDGARGRYRLSFNLPLDGVPRSTWRLQVRE